MPTYAQLQAESWWGGEIRTPELKWLGDELCRRTKRPRVAAGDKGDRFHTNGAHRSQEWILKSRYCTNRTYTVQSGLTAEQSRHIAGFDFTPGSDAAMIAQCKRLMAALKSGRLEEVREFYGNVDGNKVVDGWDNLRNRATSSDSSHLWHWHISIDRRKLRDRKLMERIVAIALGDQIEEDDVSGKDVWTYGIKSASGNTMTAANRLTDIQTDADELLRLAKAASLRDEAILAAVSGLDVKAVLARVDQRASEEAQRDAHARAELVELLEQASAERAELAHLLRQHADGSLDAEAVVRRLGELLSAASGGS